MCPKLNGNICGDFGITMVGDDGVEQHKFCHEGHMKAIELAAGEKAAIKRWYSGEFDANLCCYFWCTADGSLPESQQDIGDDQTGVQSVLKEMVNPR